MLKQEQIVKKKVGKPNLVITKEMMDKAEELASQGLEQQQIAYCLGIGLSTFYEKKNENKEFAEAIKKGKAKGIAKVTKHLLDNIEKGNVAGQIFYLKCQANWKEAKEDTNVNVKVFGEHCKTIECMIDDSQDAILLEDQKENDKLLLTT